MAGARSPYRLLIAGTSLGLAWSDRASGWVPDAPVPPRPPPAGCRRAAVGGPVGTCTTSRSEGVPADPVASLAAPLSGVRKEALLSEQRRQHRRVIRLVAAACAVLLAAAVVATGSPFIAKAQRDDARAQARIATAGELAALATANLSTNLHDSLLLAVAAARLDNNVQARAALFRAYRPAPHLVFYLQAEARVSALATAADGDVIVAGTASGQLVRFDLATGRRADLATGLAAITSVAVSASGNTVAAADGTYAVVWQAGRGGHARFAASAAPRRSLSPHPGSWSPSSGPARWPSGTCAPAGSSAGALPGSAGMKPAFGTGSELVLTTEQGAFDQLAARPAPDRVRRLSRDPVGLLHAGHVGQQRLLGLHQGRAGDGLDDHGPGHHEGLRVGDGRPA